MTQEKENKTLQSNERTVCVKVAWYLIGNCSQSADEQPCWHLQVGVLLMLYSSPSCFCSWMCSACQLRDAEMAAICGSSYSRSISSSQYRINECYKSVLVRNRPCKNSLQSKRVWQPLFRRWREPLEVIRDQMMWPRSCRAFCTLNYVWDFHLTGSELARAF